MAKTVISLFDDFKAAREAERCLTKAGLKKERISMLANKEGIDDGATSRMSTLKVSDYGQIATSGPIADSLSTNNSECNAARLIGALTANGVPEREARLYGEALRRGGSLLMTRVRDEDANETVQVIRGCDTVDIDRRAKLWSQDGWGSSNDVEVKPYTRDQIQRERERYRGQNGRSGQNGQNGRSGQTTAGATRGLKDGANEKVELLEERASVEKKAVLTGGVRVHTVIDEERFRERVNLRKEDVTVERVSMDEPARDTRGAFKPETIEVAEVNEKAVLHKDVRKVGEVRVGKRAHTETEVVEDTLRRQDVKIEQLGAETTESDEDFRQHYNTNYKTQGMSYEGVRPAYNFGWRMGRDKQFAGRDWSTAENDLYTRWQSYDGEPSAWQKFKGAVRHAYNRARVKV